MMFLFMVEDDYSACEITKIVSHNSESTMTKMEFFKTFAYFKNLNGLIMPGMLQTHLILKAGNHF